MRILSVASALPYPPDDGTRTRTWNLLSRLAETEDVTLLTWVDPGQDKHLIDEVKSKIPDSIVLESGPSDLSMKNRLSVRASSFLTMLPPYVIERMRRQPVPEFEGRTFDLAIAEDDSAAFLMPQVTCPVVVHRHNIFSDTIGGLARSADLGILRKLKWKMEMPIWNRFDRKLGQMSDLLIVTTPEAERAIRRFSPGSRVEVVTNGVEIPALPVIPSLPPVAVFIGAMNYEPNADAVGYFANDILPGIVSKVPGALFKIVGRLPIDSVRQLASDYVDVVGEVRDIREACQGAMVGVVPLRAGSGIKNKTLELMAMGLPVVATSQGCEGLDAGKEDGLIKVDTDAEFTQAVAQLMSDPQEAAHLGAKARSYVHRFSWSVATDKLVDVLRDVVSSRAAA